MSDGRLFRTRRGVFQPDDEPVTESVDVGEEQLVRIAGDTVVERRRVPARAVESLHAGMELIRPVREAEAGPDDEDEPTLPVTGFGPHGPVTIHHIDVRRRMPVMELVLQETEGLANARCFGVSHWSDDGTLGGMIRIGRNGRPEVFINLVSATALCPVKRLGLLAHEAEHWRRGDFRSGSPFAHDAVAEAECDRVANVRIAETCRTVDRKEGASDGATMDPAPCSECFTTGSRTCLQSADTLARVQRTLGIYMR